MSERAERFLTGLKAADYRGAMTTLHSRLFDARVSRGLTQEQAAIQAGVSVRAWCKYETGKAAPRAVSLGKLIRWLQEG